MQAKASLSTPRGRGVHSQGDEARNNPDEIQNKDDTGCYWTKNVREEDGE